MAGYREHLSVSGLCGGGYAAFAWFGVGLTPMQSVVAGGLTWLGGLWPDLDSRSGRPVRELTSVLAAVVPVIATARIRRFGGHDWFDADRAVLVAMAGYVVVRYGGAWLLGKLSVHRGMFHSLPAAIIAAELTWLIYPNTDWPVRLVMAGGTAVGFLSHLLLDEAHSVRWDGALPRLAKSSGTAVKWYGRDWRANAACYGLLACLTASVLEVAKPARSSVGDPPVLVEADDGAAAEGVKVTEAGSPPEIVRETRPEPPRSMKPTRNRPGGAKAATARTAPPPLVAPDVAPRPPVETVGEPGEDVMPADAFGPRPDVGAVTSRDEAGGVIIR